MKKAKTILKFTIFPVIIFVILYFLALFFSNPASDDEIRLNLFYNEPSQSIDVTYIGPSTVMADIVPTDCYEQGGFTSYNFSMAAMPMKLIKPILNECEITQKSKLYVIEINNVTYASTSSDVTIRNFLSGIPDAGRRQKYLDELIPADEQFKFKDKLYANHGKWQNIGDIITNLKLNTKNKRSVLKGLGFFTSAPFGIRGLLDSNDYLEEELEPNAENMKLLDELLSYITDNDLKDRVLFYATPRFYTKDTIDEFKMLNYLEKYLTGKGFKVKNYTKDMDYVTPEDYQDYSHLMIDGARKFTKKLTEDILALNILTDIHHSEEVEKHWQECVSKVNAFIEASKAGKVKKTSIYSDLVYFDYYK